MSHSPHFTRVRSAGSSRAWIVILSSGWITSFVASGCGPDDSSSAQDFVHATAEQNVTAGVPLPPPNGAFAPLDIDQDGNTDALTDGLLVIRHLFGFRNNGLTDRAVNLEFCLRCTSSEIADYLTTLEEAGDLDIDEDGMSDALTDGLLVTRFLFGFRGNSLVDSACGIPPCSALTIEARLRSLTERTSFPTCGLLCPEGSYASRYSSVNQCGGFTLINHSYCEPVERSSPFTQCAVNFLYSSEVDLSCPDTHYPLSYSQASECCLHPTVPERCGASQRNQTRCEPLRSDFRMCGGPQTDCPAGYYVVERSFDSACNEDTTSPNPVNQLRCVQH